MKKATSLTVQNTAINLKRINASDFLSLTDIARAKNPDEPKDVVKNWLRSRQTIDFLGLWEQINNPDFKGVEFDSFKNQAGTNSFVLTPKREEYEQLTEELNTIQNTQKENNKE